VRLFSIGEPSTSDHTGQEHTLCAVFQSKEVTRVALSIKFHGKVDISESPPDASDTTPSPGPSGSRSDLGSSQTVVVDMTAFTKGYALRSEDSPDG